MNQASRIKLAKQLIHCARMVLDAAQFKNNREKEAKFLIARKSDTIKKYIFSYLPEILEKGINNGINQKRCAIHHMKDNKTKKYISVDTLDEETYQKVLCAIMYSSQNNDRKNIALQQIKNMKYDENQIKKISNEIKDEIKSCVLLPISFHNWLNGNLKSGQTTIKLNGQIYPLTNRDDYYNFLKKFASDKIKLKKVSKIKFEDKTLINAINSLYRISDFITPDINNENEKLVKTLHNVYKKLLNIIKKKNLAMSIQDDLTKGMQENTPST